MIKNLRTIAFVIFAIIPLGIGPLHALGIGFYTTGNAGISTLENSLEKYFEKSKEQSKGKLKINYGLGAGFVLDTAVAKNELFNYRLNVGYENEINSDLHFFQKYSVNRITVSNTFGFGIYRSKYLRVWTGPQIELGCQFINTSGLEINGIPTDLTYEKNSIDYALFTLGIGAVLGININPRDLFTMSFEIGLNTLMGVGRYHVSESLINYYNMPGYYRGIIPMKLSSSAYDRAFGKVEGFSRLSFIFRIDDNYLPDILLH